MVSETGSASRATTSVTDAARLGLDAGLVVVCLGVVGFGLQLGAGSAFGPLAGWIALGVVLLVAVGVSALVGRTQGDDGGSDPAIAWLAALGPAVAGAWTLLVFAPRVGWVYPPPRWVVPTVLALPTAVLCGTVGYLLDRTSRGLSPDTFGEPTLAVPVLAMLVALLSFGVSLPKGLWLDTAFSGSLVGTTLPFCGALLAVGVGTATAGWRVLGAAGADRRTAGRIALAWLAGWTVAGTYAVAVVGLLGYVTLVVNPFVVLDEIRHVPLAVAGVAVAVLTAVGVELLGDALAPAPWLAGRVRRLLGESVAGPTLAAGAETTRSLTAGGVAALAVVGFCATGVATLGTSGGGADPSVLVVTGAACVGALGGRRVSAWVRADPGR
jgi:hypothetical protein